MFQDRRHKRELTCLIHMTFRSNNRKVTIRSTKRHGKSLDDLGLRVADS